MANLDGKNELEWMERVKSGGAVPLLEPDNCPNGWASPPGDKFMVRGSEYFSTKVKIPGGGYLLQPLGFDWIKGSTKIWEVLNQPNSRIRKALEDEFPTGDKPFVWAFNLQVPSKDNYSAVAYFVSTEPIPEGSLMDQFLKGDDGFRNSRLKLIANIVKGPWIVRKAVGEQAICIIGRALSCKYCIAENFVEVDVDIGSSMVASAIVHLAFGYITTLTVDLAFLIESQTQSELPERILGAVRFSELNPASAGPIGPSSDGSAGSLQSSLSTRLWKSIGQGFSHLLHPGAQESGSVSGSSHVNGIIDHEDGNENIKNLPGQGGSLHPGAQESGSFSGLSHVNGIVDNEQSSENIKNLPGQGGSVSGSSHVNGIIDHEDSYVNIKNLPGQGGSLHPGAQESGSLSGTSHVNGIVDTEDTSENIKNW